MRDFRGKEPPFGPHDDSEADAPPFELEMLEAALVVATGAPQSTSVHSRIVPFLCGWSCQSLAGFWSGAAVPQSCFHSHFLQEQSAGGCNDVSALIHIHDIEQGAWKRCCRQQASKSISIVLQRLQRHSAYF